MKLLFPLTLLLLLISAAPAKAERTIHVFTVFCNAYEGAGGAINDGVSADKVMIENLFKSYFSPQSWGVQLRQQSVEGSAATREQILTNFEAFTRAVGPEDTLYVHFSGHGVIPDAAAGEQFLQAVDEQLFSRKVWAEAIDALPCRLKILITDCCSTYPEGFVVAEGDEDVEPWKNLYSLLLEHEGFVNITAASPGQPAYGTEFGGFLTINLESDMQRFSTWEKVFASASSRVAVETKEQLRAIGATDALPQEPFAYTLGVYSGKNKVRPEALEYVIPDSHSRKLTRSELEVMGLKQLYLARNEIFARYGYDFGSPFLQEYFGSLSWYEAIEGFKNPAVTDLETANANLILQIEKENGGPFISTKQSLPGEGDAAPDIFSWSSEQSLSRSVLQNLTPQQLSIARNEIYARHGYPFSSPALQRHFAKKPYYVRSSSKAEPDFNAVEKHNLWLIRKIERLNGGAYSW